MTDTDRRRAWAEIDLDALRHNIRALDSRYAAKGSRLMAIVKADAYGHDIRLIAPACRAAGLRDFGVATTDEALALRALLPDAAIYVLPPAPPADAADLVAANIVPLCSDLGFAQALSAAARRQGKTVRIHVDIDTGMGRSGFAPADVPAALDAIAALPGLAVTGLVTHFARADEDPADAHAQHALFLGVLERLGPAAAGLDIHSSNSPAALVLGERGRHTILRPGLLLYGIEPAPGMFADTDLDLRPVLSLKARVTLSRTLPPGATISYGKTYTVPPTGGRYATVAIGYGDGLSRRLSNIGHVGLHGRPAPIRGRVCMDQLVADITDIDNVAPGDIATIVGVDNAFRQTAGDIAAITGQTPHEIPTELLPRIPRIAVN